MEEVKTRIICDVCGVELSAGQHHGLSQFTEEYIRSITIETHLKQVTLGDICLQCNNKIYNLIREIKYGTDS